MSRKDLTIFVDLDGTLKTEHGIDGPFEVNTIHVTSGKNHFNIGIRPHIHEFLQAAKTKGKLILSTAAGRNYAKNMLAAMNISQYFDEIITAEKFRTGIPNYTNCIWIDNHEDQGQQKMAKMASSLYTRIKRKDLWIIDTYYGKKNDRTMLELIEELKTL